MKFAPLVVCFLFAGLLSSCTMMQDGALQFAREDIQRENYGDALAALDRAEEYSQANGKKMAEIYWLRAVAFVQTGRISEAKANLRQAEKYGDTIYAEYAKELLKKIQGDERTAR